MLGLLESPHCVNKNSAAVSSQVEQAKRYAMPPMTSRGSGRAPGSCASSADGGAWWLVQLPSWAATHPLPLA
jgi:hypothetical protein